MVFFCSIPGLAYRVTRLPHPQHTYNLDGQVGWGVSMHSFYIWPGGQEEALVRLWLALGLGLALASSASHPSLPTHKGMAFPAKQTLGRRRRALDEKRREELLPPKKHWPGFHWDSHFHSGSGFAGRWRWHWCWRSPSRRPPQAKAPHFYPVQALPLLTPMPLGHLFIRIL